MHGQWIGKYKGTNSGTIMVDIDNCGDHFEGAGVVFDDAGLPGSLVPFNTFNTEASQSFTNMKIVPLDPQTANVTSLEVLKQQYAAKGLELTFPSQASINMRVKGGFLEIDWETDVGSSGTARLPKSKAGSPSKVQPVAGVTSWGEFKAAVAALERRRYIFRGQASVWRLRTAFHRSRRKDLFQFISTDVPRLHQVLSGQTKHHFNLTDNQQNGAFWNLIQHHGYPTPLLDWSNSPFVAAFFAYRNKLQDDEHAPKVRIYAFDRLSWCRDFAQLSKAAPCMPHFSIIESLALENPRLVPQQALSSVTNVDDIETYIRARERDTGKTYLTAYDLPASNAGDVLGELGLMGISAGALFPGLDGVCEEWRYRNFGY